MSKWANEQMSKWANEQPPKEAVQLPQGVHHMGKWANVEYCFIYKVFSSEELNYGGCRP